MRFVLTLMLAGCLLGCGSDVADESNFRPLFDGATLDGWRGIGQSGVPEGHWIVTGGSIQKVASGSVARAEDGQVLEGGDLMTDRAFEGFDFRFEWRVAPGANSGIKYNVDEDISIATPPTTGALGFEYQVLDDSLHVDAALASHRSGSLYDLLAAPDDKPIEPVGAWNTGRIVWHEGRGEHWMNGVKVVSFDVASEAFAEAFAASKYAGFDDFAPPRPGHIVLQDHGDDVWFRNLRIRELP